MPSSLRRKLQNTMEMTQKAPEWGSPSGTSSFLLVAIKATLDKLSFKTGSEVAAHAYEAVDTLRVRCANETNEVPYTEFSYLFPKGLEGALPTDVTFVVY